MIGGFPGSGLGSCGSGSFDGGGMKTVRRSSLTLPLPFNFSANGFQQSAQMSYSRLSISFGKHSFGCPHRSQTIMISSRRGRSLRSNRYYDFPKSTGGESSPRPGTIHLFNGGELLAWSRGLACLLYARSSHPPLPILSAGDTHFQTAP